MIKCHLQPGKDDLKWVQHKKVEEIYDKFTMKSMKKKFKVFVLIVDIA